MQSGIYRKILCLIGITLSCSGMTRGQERDSMNIRELTDVEIVEKRRTSVTRESAPVQLLEKGRIEQLGLQNLSEAVWRFSGVTVRDYGGVGGLKTVSVRSLGAHHTAVSYDGVTITDAQSGQVDISRFSLDDVKSVSLVMGQSDEIFQTARMFASAGVLSIKTEKPSFEHRSFYLQGGVDAGSFGYVNPSIRYGQKLNKTYSFTLHSDWMHADSRYPYSTSYENIHMEGKRKNSDIESFRTEINLYSDWQQKGTLQVKGYWFDSERGLPGSLIYREDYSVERLQNKNGFVQAAYRNSLHEKVSLKVFAKVDYARTRYQDFHSAYPDGHKTDRYTQKEYYGSAVLGYNPLKTIRFVLSQDFFVNELEATLNNFADPRRYTSLTVIGAQYRNSRFTATGSLLNTFIKEEAETYDPSKSKRLSPAVSFSYRIFPHYNLRVRGSYKDIFRTPTFNDLYYGQSVKKSLKPEKARQYNLGVTWGGEVTPLAIDYLSVSADGYYNQVKDKIIAFPTMFIWQMVNMGQVNIKGIDFNLSSRFVLPAGMFLRMDGNYSWQDATDATEKGSKVYGHQIPYTPVHTGNTSVTWENPWVNISWLLTAVGQRYSMAQNIEQNRMPGYVEQQLSFNRDIKWKEVLLKLHVEILNIGDVSYDVIRYYPMPGRTFRAGVKVIY